MEIVSKKVAELNEKIGHLSEEVAAGMIQKSGLEPDFEFNAGPLKVRAILPTQAMIEEVMELASRDSRGQELDMTSREPKARRLTLAKIITEFVDEVSFKIGDEEDEQIKLSVLARLPDIMIERMWFGFQTQRTAMMLVLTRGGGEVLKKSSASPSGETDGDSSNAKEESASTEASSQNSTPSNSPGPSIT